MRKVPLYVAIARVVCWDPLDPTWTKKKQERLKELLDELPSGSGWDMGTKLDSAKSNLNSVKSNLNRIVLYGSYHHMNEVGMYDGWTDHEIHVTPSLMWGFDLRITGKDRNDIKDYLHDLFHEALMLPVWEHDYAAHGGFVVEDREGEPVEVVWNEASGVWDVFVYEPTVVRLYSSSGR